MAPATPRVLDGAEMDLSTAVDNARKGQLLPVYLLGGDERLSITRAVEVIRTAVVGGGPRGLSEDLFDGKQSSAGAVITAARTLPMMAKRRLVTVRAVEQMSADDQEAVIGYFAKPEPSTVLLLVALQLDGRRRLALEAKKHGYLFVAASPDEESLPGWIEGEAKARGIALGTGVAESLGMAIGPDLALLTDALERLGLYADGRPLTPQDVDRCVTPVRAIESWDLTRALGHRNLDAALSALARLEAQRQEPLMTLGAVAYHFRVLAKARRYFAQGAKQPPGAALKVRREDIDGFLEQGRKWSAPQLRRAVRVLAATDAALKGAKRDRGRIIEECAIALCGGAGMGELPG